MIKTKIIATYGPAVANEAAMLAMLRHGVDVVRLNFSHGNHAEKEDAVALVRHCAEQLGRVVAIMGDLCGQKIRLTDFEDGSIHVEPGDRLRIERDAELGNKERVGTNYPDFVDDVQIGHRLMIDDGFLQFVVIDKDASHVLARCVIGGELSSRKGINVPDTTIRAPSLTQKDHDDIDWAIKHKLDYICVSFCRSPEDILTVKQRLAAHNNRMRVIAKVEMREAVEKLDQIIQVSNGIMVARGDLGVEIDIAQVPIVQKDITMRCQQAGKPCIIATQMLQSMVDGRSPTRAEVSDVANAVFDMTDAVMLSAETAVGKYPPQVVKVMDEVISRTEQYIATTPKLPVTVREHDLPSTSRVATGIARLAHEVDAKVVAVWTVTGNTVRLLSKHRLRVPVLGLSNQLATCQALALHYGVLPAKAHRHADLKDLLAETDQIVMERELARPGDAIVVAAPQPLKDAGNTTTVFVHLVGPYQPSLEESRY